MKKIILNWKPQESWIKDLFDEDYKEIAMKIADFIKPTSFEELGDLYHGENKYHFFPDFSQWVNKGVDSIKECITALSSQETNTYFQEYMLELTPDVFRPFMEGVFNSGNIDWHENIWKSFGFNDRGQLLSGSTEIIDEIIKEPPPVGESGFIEVIGKTIQEPPPVEPGFIEGIINFITNLQI